MLPKRGQLEPYIAAAPFLDNSLFEEPALVNPCDRWGFARSIGDAFHRAQVIAFQHCGEEGDVAVGEIAIRCIRNPADEISSCSFCFHVVLRLE